MVSVLRGRLPLTFLKKLTEELSNDLNPPQQKQQINTCYALTNTRQSGLNFSMTSLGYLLAQLIVVTLFLMPKLKLIKQQQKS